MQHWLKNRFDNLPLDLPYESTFPHANKILRLMKYNALTEYKCEIFRPIYNYQAVYFLKFKTTPFGIRKLRKMLDGRSMFPTSPEQIDQVFSDVYFETSDRKHKGKRFRSKLVDECYQEYEAKLKIVFDIAKYPERFYSDAQPL